MTSTVGDSDLRAVGDGLVAADVADRRRAGDDLAVMQVDGAGPGGWRGRRRPSCSRRAGRRPCRRRPRRAADATDRRARRRRRGRARGLAGVASRAPPRSWRRLAAVAEARRRWTSRRRRWPRPRCACRGVRAATACSALAGVAGQAGRRRRGVTAGGERRRFRLGRRTNEPQDGQKARSTTRRMRKGEMILSTPSLSAKGLRP